MLSILSKHKLLQSKFGTKIDQFNNILVSIVIAAIFILAYSALLRPINQLQYQTLF